MNDYISREDVLNGRIWVQTSNGVEVSHMQAVPVGYIANLSPADVQLDTKELVAKIKKGISATNADDVYSCGMRDGMRWCMSLVDDEELLFENCPSAQPEQRCVNCGRTINNGGWYEDGRTRCPIEEHYALPKDGYCHLWEKVNVWNDNYPEEEVKNERFDKQTGGD